MYIHIYIIDRKKCVIKKKYKKLLLKIALFHATLIPYIFMEIEVSFLLSL